MNRPGPAEALRPKATHNDYEAWASGSAIAGNMSVIALRTTEPWASDIDGVTMSGCQRSAGPTLRRFVVPRARLVLAIMSDCR